MGLNMKIKTITFLLLALMIAFSGCTESGDEEPASEDTGMDTENETAGETADESVTEAPDAASLYASFTGDDNYMEWSIWPGTEAMMEGNGVHGDYVSIYVSDNALSAAQAKESVMPYETIVLKEGFNADEELTGVYIMYKSEGYDPENNDWFWASYAPDGAVRSEGKVSGCISCHEGKSDVDYIFVNA